MDEADVMEEDDNDNAKPLLLMIKANAFKALVSSFQPKHFAAQGKSKPYQIWFNENDNANTMLLT